MKIESLHIKNFRNVAEATYNLNPHFTVVIGINGKGKSTILHALRVACGAYLLSIPDAKSRHIEADEIRCTSHGTFLSPKTPVIIEAHGNFRGEPLQITWRRRIPEGKNHTTSSNEDVGIIRDLGKAKFDKMRNGSDDLDLPVIAFFGTSRLHGAARNRISRIGRQIFKEGYYSWNEMRSSVYGYDAWLTTYSALLSEKKEYPESKKAFWDAMKTAAPFINKIDFVGTELWLKVEIEDYTSEYLPIRLHSDGVQSFIEMVAELAYRCIVLNGSKRANAIIDTQGVVLIDEIDQHLHPNWQRKVVGDLKAAFPNLQFVATTHSPFIVQSLKKEELINLDTTEGLEKDPLYYGIEDVAEAENLVKNIPRSEQFIEMVQTAERYYELISMGKESRTDHETAILRARLNEMEERFSDDPAFVALLKSERKAKAV
jgi:predicted ATP-binding protein involved in virulence